MEVTAGGEQHVSWSNLLGVVGRDLFINCFVRLSRSYYGSVACLNRDFNSLVRSGEIYRLRRKNGVAEHWVYSSFNALEWVAYDPYRARWIQVPRMPPDECFMASDKESLAVGTELLIFAMAHMVFKYSILTNSWTRADPMNWPRCLFGSASVDGKAYVAGGTDAAGKVLSSAEMYDSDTHTWTTLPSMNRARKMCSGVFMDGKFYAIGGVTNNNEVLTCGEEYDLNRLSWRVIENMSEGLNVEVPWGLLIAVVNNELYAADHSENGLKKYDKLGNKWITLGKLPELCWSKNSWGFALQACGDRLIVIGCRTSTDGMVELQPWIPDQQLDGIVELQPWIPDQQLDDMVELQPWIPDQQLDGMVELYSWIPDQQPPVWNLVASRQSGNFVYNCAVMGC